MQFVVVCIYFFILAYVAHHVNLENRLIKWFKSRFMRGTYNNVAQLLLSSQISVCFSCSTTMIDRTFSSPYKLFNFAVAAFIVFLSVILVVVHPTVLRRTKRQPNQFTKDCYEKSKRGNDLAEWYVMTGLFVRIAVSVGIPLLPGFVALLVITLAAIN